MVSAGIKGKKEGLVQEENTAKAVGSGTLRVFATPSMLALMEAAASESVAPYLEAGCGTVGTRLDVRHLSATPVGMKVSAESEVVEVEGKRIVFRVAAYDECGLIGEGLHERVIITEKRFTEKAYGKLGDCSQ